MPRSSQRSSNRRTPRNTSRTTSIDHLSPTSSATAAIVESAASAGTPLTLPTRVSSHFELTAARVPRMHDVELLRAPLTDLLAAASTKRTSRRITYSPKVFIPLTTLCRDRCGYCTFAESPARAATPYLEPDAVL